MFDPLVLASVTRGCRGLFEGPLGLFEDLFDPQVDQAGLDLEFLGQVGDRLLPGQMPPDNLGLLFR